MIKGILAYCYAYEVASDCRAAQRWHKVTRRCCGNIKTAMKSLGDGSRFDIYVATPHPSKLHPFFKPTLFIHPS